MKKKSKRLRTIKKKLAKEKNILSKAKKSFTSPSKLKKAFRSYIFHDEKSKKYLSKSGIGEVTKNKTGSPIWLTKNQEEAAIFFNNSIGINKIIPLMRSGAWRIIRIK